MHEPVRMQKFCIHIILLKIIIMIIIIIRNSVSLTCMLFRNRFSFGGIYLENGCRNSGCPFNMQNNQENKELIKVIQRKIRKNSTSLLEKSKGN